MLQTYRVAQPSPSEDRAQPFDLGRLLDIAKRRIFYFAIPFVLLLTTGCLIVAIQRPIYEAQGKILVESPEIPTDLVEPTVTAAATERIQVIQQRLMARDSLLPIVDKFDLFPSERKWMSGTQILDLMRQRAQIALVDITAQIGGQSGYQAAKNNAVAFTVSFDYENPDLAAKVANELLTAILGEDVRSRTSRATETTEFMAQEVKRLRGRLDAINQQIFAAKQQAADPKNGASEVPDLLKQQTAELTAMKADLIQKSSVYSDEFPAIKALKKRIAMLEQQIAKTAKPQAAAAPGQDVDALEQQQDSLAKELDVESKKLTAATLGEAMERNEQSEHLQVIEQPIAPQKPIRPNRIKLFAASLGLAMAAGFGVVVLAEMLDKTIRGSRELAGVVDSHLLVSIPYIATAGELRRRKTKFIVAWAALAIVLLVGIATAFYIGVEVDFSWFDRSWIDSLTRLSK